MYYVKSTTKASAAGDDSYNLLIFPKIELDTVIPIGGGNFKLALSKSIFE
jgi:hypothetical protein